MGRLYPQSLSSTEEPSGYDNPSRRMESLFIHPSDTSQGWLLPSQATVTVPQTSRLTHEGSWLGSSVVASPKPNQQAEQQKPLSEMRPFTTLRQQASWWEMLTGIPSFSGQILNKPLETDCGVHGKRSYPPFAAVKLFPHPHRPHPQHSVVREGAPPTPSTIHRQQSQAINSAALFSLSAPDIYTDQSSKVTFKYSLRIEEPMLPFDNLSE